MLSKYPLKCEEKLYALHDTGNKTAMSKALSFNMSPKQEFGPSLRGSEHAQPLPLNRSIPRRANVNNIIKKSAKNTASSRRV
jgi:hypothetical protein